MTLLQTATKLFFSRTYCSSNKNMGFVRNKHKINKEEEAKKIKDYVISRYIDYLKYYDQIIANRFPTAYRLYRSFMDGTGDFLKEVKEYYKIVRIYNREGFAGLRRKEIELYHQMPKDMLKVAPILFFSALPFTGYLLFPLIYKFPKQLLSQQFWNLQQKSEFSRTYLQNRLTHNKPAFRHVQHQLEYLHFKESKYYKPWKKVLAMVGSGVQPSVEQILECKELFEDEPYHLLYLSPLHVGHLAKMHDIRSIFRKRANLARRAIILQEMDKAIIREGGVHNLSKDVLQNCCIIRGLNPTTMKTEDMVEWMRKWIQISSETDRQSLSLLLHCPILLGYNEPSNWALIYK